MGPKSEIRAVALRWGLSVYLDKADATSLPFYAPPTRVNVRCCRWHDRPYVPSRPRTAIGPRRRVPCRALDDGRKISGAQCQGQASHQARGSPAAARRGAPAARIPRWLTGAVKASPDNLAASAAMMVECRSATLVACRRWLGASSRLLPSRAVFRPVSYPRIDQRTRALTRRRGDGFSALPLPRLEAGA